MGEIASTSTVHLGTKWAQFGHEMGTNMMRFREKSHNYLFLLVGVRGFEPPTPASRTQYSTRLSYTPNQHGVENYCEAMRLR